MKKNQSSLAAQARARVVAKGIVAGKTGKQAMLDAGYSLSTATHCYADLQRKIREQLAVELDKQLPRDELVRTLIKTATGAKKTERLMCQRTGEVQSFEDDDRYAQIKASELLAKMVGALVRREEVNVQHNVTLAERIASGRKRLVALAEPEPEVTAEVVSVSAKAEPVIDDSAKAVPAVNAADGMPPEIDTSGLKSGAELLSQGGE